VHEHRKQHALRAVIDPDHEYAEDDEEQEWIEHVAGQSQRAGDRAAQPVGREQVPDGPDRSHDEAGRADGKPLPQHRNRESGPAQLLEEPGRESDRDPGHEDGGRVFRHEQGGFEARRGERESGKDGNDDHRREQEHQQVHTRAHPPLE
jgi:hypothetical protein